MKCLLAVHPIQRKRYVTDFYMLCDSMGYTPTDDTASVNSKNHGDDATGVIFIYL
jgi:hypothetical protein